MKPLPPVKVCSECKRVVHIKRDGTPIVHKTKWGGGSRCSGIGKRYMVVDVSQINFKV